MNLSYIYYGEKVIAVPTGFFYLKKALLLYKSIIALIHTLYLNYINQHVYHFSPTFFKKTQAIFFFFKLKFSLLNK